MARRQRPAAGRVLAWHLPAWLLAAPQLQRLATVKLAGASRLQLPVVLLVALQEALLASLVAAQVLQASVLVLRPAQPQQVQLDGRQRWAAAVGVPHGLRNRLLVRLSALAELTTAQPVVVELLQPWVQLLRNRFAPRRSSSAADPGSKLRGRAFLSLTPDSGQGHRCLLATLPRTHRASSRRAWQTSVPQGRQSCPSNVDALRPGHLV
mmetsp:Transcript_24168/g.60373  ORF Transcript_24168/g.60373 Transcript_24168/m.60373 type:complete len:209 (-) Transcript_24168:347-973(-)